MAEILAPISLGELLDKISILEIKSERIADAGKLANIQRELDALRAVWTSAPSSRQDISLLMQMLKAVNERLWDIEDAIRAQEHAQTFDGEFIRLARAVYFENDERARIKREINIQLGSAYVEEKSYRQYGDSTENLPRQSEQ